MNGARLLEWARRDAGLTQDELAPRARTSRPTVSAYEHARTSPTLDTAIRILAACGRAVEAVPIIEFTERMTRRGRPFQVPSQLPRLPLDRAFGKSVPPLHVNWSDDGRSWDMKVRRERARLYTDVIVNGLLEDILALIDGALLVDVWDEMTFEKEIKEAWQPLIDAALGRTVGS